MRNSNYKGLSAHAALAPLMLLATFFLILPVSTAQADPVEGQKLLLTKTEETSVRQELSEMKVSSATQDELIERLSRGEVWDSLSGAEPTSTEVLDGGGTLETFADGSAVLTGIEAPREPTSQDSGIGVRATGNVTGCVAKPKDSNGYSVRTDCVVRKTYAVHGMKFIGDYKVKSGQAGRITGVRHGEVWSYISTYEIISKPTITKSTGSGKSPATARFEVKFKAANGIHYPTVHGWIQMNVTTKAWVTWG